MASYFHFELLLYLVHMQNGNILKSFLVSRYIVIWDRMDLFFYMKDIFYLFAYFLFEHIVWSGAVRRCVCR